METKSKKILIVSSPTGGHIYPAIEIGRRLLKIGYGIVFVTQKHTKFIEVIRKELKSTNSNFKIETISAEKFSRTNPVQLITFLISMLISSVKTVKILFFYKPKTIFSTGGYTSVPIILISRIFFPRIEIILQEQNYVFGLTNKLLSIFADKICCGFPTEKKLGLFHSSKKYIFTGNPIREKFKARIDKEEIYAKYGLDSKKFTILVFGGSQGAKSLNEVIIKFLKIKIESLENVQIIHLTGWKNFERVKDEYKNIITKNVVLPYLDNMAKAYVIADLIISRAGAMTVSELIYFRKPSILIPFPFAAEFHQNWNAYYLAKYGCAVVIYQKEDWEEKVINSIIFFINNKDKLEIMKRNFNKLPIVKDNIEKIIL